MKKVVLGVKIDDVSMEEAIQFICHSDKSRMTVFTPGPEFFVEAYKNKEFRDILNSSDLNVSDGSGAQYLCRVKNRVPGYELMLRLCEEAAKQNLTIGLFGGFGGVAKKAKLVLEQKYPGIKIKWAIDGKEADNIIANVIPDKRSADPESIWIPGYARDDKVDLLFVALGMVKQEKFLFGNKDKFKIGVGVGGSFNEIVGLEKTPPKFINQIGLKWLWRLICEPKRIKRIINAVIVFPLLILRDAIMTRDVREKS